MGDSKGEVVEAGQACFVDHHAIGIGVSTDGAYGILHFDGMGGTPGAAATDGAGRRLAWMVFHEEHYFLKTVSIAFEFLRFRDLLEFGSTFGLHQGVDLGFAHLGVEFEVETLGEQGAQHGLDTSAAVGIV